MKSHLARCSSVVVLALASLLVGAGCASSPRPIAQQPITSTAVLDTPPPRAPPGGSIVLSVDIRKACAIGEENAYFAFDSTEIQADDSSTLDAVANCFLSGPLRDRSLSLVGRADPRGNAAYNLVLGQGRADAVVEQLEAHGVPPERLNATSRGALDATGSDEEGWAQDRRVDVTLGS
jgi:peptidoglycan-associated lipoprotein